VEKFAEKERVKSGIKDIVMGDKKTNNNNKCSCYRDINDHIRFFNIYYF